MEMRNVDWYRSLECNAVEVAREFENDENGGCSQTIFLIISKLYEMKWKIRKKRKSDTLYESNTYRT